MNQIFKVLIEAVSHSLSNLARVNRRFSIKMSLHSREQHSILGLFASKFLPHMTHIFTIIHLSMSFIF